MKLNFRKANPADLAFLMNLEQEVFPEFQQSTKQNIKKGLKSSFQEFLIVEINLDKKNRKSIGSAVLFKYKHMLRIYSIGVLNEYKKKGIGNSFIDYIKDFAIQNNFTSVTLEARIKNQELINWYQAKGFNIIKTIENYYCAGEHAYKLGLRIGQKSIDKAQKNLIIIDQPYTWEETDVRATIISVKEYINNSLYQNNQNFRVFNLCSSYKYQSYGYYVSLLASARGQRVVPNITTIRDLNMLNVIQSMVFDLTDLINRNLNKQKGNSFSLDIFFGQTATKGYKTLAAKLFQLFEAPLFTVNFIKDDTWIIKSIKVLTFKNLGKDKKEQLYEFAYKYFNKKRFNTPKLTNYRYDIAILINPFEENPPSNKEALEKFRLAAEKKGVYVEFITKNDKNRINEFDALFIRETTNVNHYTYELSRLAFAEGLVVIDDPWSILKCSNKIYQHELFAKNKIRTPKTIAITKNMFSDSMLSKFNYPVVLKQPDSAFSLGVIKVNNKTEAKAELNKLFKKTDMVISQEFLYSEYDWRIGVLDNKAIFACKYYMTENHWQIYNWNSENDENTGNHETIAIDEVPQDILKIATKSASLIGDGLYGVDLKHVNGKTYVIEVNDNPNIDVGVEDLVLNDELYSLIIDSLITRIELLKNIRKIDLIK